VLSFSQTSSNLKYEPKVIKDSSGVTFLAFDSLQTIRIIKSLKDVGWNKKQIKELEKQLKNFKFLNDKQNEKNNNLEKKIQDYIEIEINLNKQVSVKEKKISEIEYNNKDLQTINDNLTTIKEQYESKIKKLQKQKFLLIVVNSVTVILLILTITTK
jgi:hypothetical protein